MESFFDLPAHVFLVHIPVVLTPVVCAAAVAVALRPAWRRRYGILLVVATLAVMAGVLLAFYSGLAFKDAVRLDETIQKHQNLAETTRLLVIALFVVSVGLVLAGRRHDAVSRSPRGPASENAQASGRPRGQNVGVGGAAGPWAGVMYGFAGATIVLAILSTVWIVRTGHEGARHAWEGVLPDSAAAAQPATTTTVASSTTSTTVPSTTDSASTTSTVGSATTTVPAGGEVDGAVVFADNCARCHGPDGSGGRGPSLIGTALTTAEIQAQIRVGGGGMPTFQQLLNDPEIAAVVAFVEAL